MELKILLIFSAIAAFSLIFGWLFEKSRFKVHVKIRRFLLFLFLSALSLPYLKFTSLASSILVKRFGESWLQWHLADDLINLVFFLIYIVLIFNSWSREEKHSIPKEQEGINLHQMPEQDYSLSVKNIHPKAFVGQSELWKVEIKPLKRERIFELKLNEISDIVKIESHSQYNGYLEIELSQVGVKIFNSKIQRKPLFDENGYALLDSLEFYWLVKFTEKGDSKGFLSFRIIHKAYIHDICLLPFTINLVDRKSFQSYFIKFGLTFLTAVLSSSLKVVIEKLIN